MLSYALDRRYWESLVEYSAGVIASRAGTSENRGVSRSANIAIEKLRRRSWNYQLRRAIVIMEKLGLSLGSWFQQDDINWYLCEMNRNDENDVIGKIKQLSWAIYRSFKHFSFSDVTEHLLNREICISKCSSISIIMYVHKRCHRECGNLPDSDSHRPHVASTGKFALKKYLWENVNLNRAESVQQTSGAIQRIGSQSSLRGRKSEPYWTLAELSFVTYNLSCVFLCFGWTWKFLLWDSTSPGNFYPSWVIPNSINDRTW